MSIQFTCACGKIIAAADYLSGKRVRCPHCGAVVTVPGVAQRPPGPAIRIDAQDIAGAKVAPPKKSPPRDAVAPQAAAQPPAPAAPASSPTDAFTLSTESRPPPLPVDAGQAAADAAAPFDNADTNIVLPERMKANRRIAGKTCPICQAAINLGEDIHNCQYCKLPFHQVCWDENGGCGSYGCAAAPVRKKMQPDFTLNAQELSSPPPLPAPPPYGSPSYGAPNYGDPAYSSPYSYPQPGYPYSVPQRTSGYAIASLVLGLVSACGIGSILAIIFGHIALAEIRDSHGSIGGRGMAIAGIILGWAVVAIVVLWLIIAFALSDHY